MNTRVTALLAAALMIPAAVADRPAGRQRPLVRRPGPLVVAKTPERGTDTVERVRGAPSIADRLEHPRRLGVLGGRRSMIAAPPGDAGGQFDRHRRPVAIA